ncbi:hypothetical protein, partial [Xanthomonas sacchari]|uniref:hypothetical protein n=1 Tax=Xanthomonas sacchari TaxID=56458 RepID=UPI002253C55F
PDQKGVDGKKKAAMMGGSVRRKALGFEDEPASTASKRGVDGNKKPAIMGGSLGRKRRGEKGKGAEAGPEVL